jgi:hypothetical protein
MPWRLISEIAARLHAFWTSTLHRDELSVSQSGCLSPRKCPWPCNHSEFADEERNPEFPVRI